MDLFEFELMVKQAMERKDFYYKLYELLYQVLTDIFVTEDFS